MYTSCHIRIFNSIIWMCVRASVSTACGCILIRTFYHFSNEKFCSNACLAEESSSSWKQERHSAHPKVAISQLSQHQSSKYGLDRSNRLTNITVQSSFHLELLNKGNNSRTQTHAQTICDYSFMCIMLENEPPPFCIGSSMHALTSHYIYSLARSVSLSKRKFSISTFCRNELMMILNRNTLFE